MPLPSVCGPASRGWPPPARRPPPPGDCPATGAGACLHPPPLPPRRLGLAHTQGNPLPAGPAASAAPRSLKSRQHLPQGAPHGPWPAPVAAAAAAWCPATPPPRPLPRASPSPLPVLLAGLPLPLARPAAAQLLYRPPAARPPSPPPPLPLLPPPTPHLPVAAHPRTPPSRTSLALGAHPHAVSPSCRCRAAQGTGKRRRMTRR